MEIPRTLALFIITALAEILGCYLPYLWLWVVDSVRPTTTDWIGVSVCLLGMAIIMLGALRAH